MIKGHGVILKGGMAICLGGVSCITRLGEKGQIGQLQRFCQVAGCLQGYPGLARTHQGVTDGADQQGQINRREHQKNSRFAHKIPFLLFVPAVSLLHGLNRAGGDFRKFDNLFTLVIPQKLFCIFSLMKRNQFISHRSVDVAADDIVCLLPIDKCQ